MTGYLTTPSGKGSQPRAALTAPPHLLEQSSLASQHLHLWLAGATRSTPHAAPQDPQQLVTAPHHDPLATPTCSSLLHRWPEPTASQDPLILKLRTAKMRGWESHQASRATFLPCRRLLDVPGHPPRLPSHSPDNGAGAHGRAAEANKAASLSQKGLARRCHGADELICIWALISVLSPGTGGLGAAAACLSSPAFTGRLRPGCVLGGVGLMAAGSKTHSHRPQNAGKCKNQELKLLPLRSLRPQVSLQAGDAENIPSAASRSILQLGIRAAAGHRISAARGSSNTHTKHEQSTFPNLMLSLPLLSLPSKKRFQSLGSLTCPCHRAGACSCLLTAPRCFSPFDRPHLRNSP